MEDFIEIPAEHIIKEAITQHPDYCNTQYIVYISPCDLENKIHVNTDYVQQGTKVKLCVHYDRELCESLAEYRGLDIEDIERQAYNAWMDGAR